MIKPGNIPSYCINCNCPRYSFVLPAIALIKNLGKFRAITGKMPKLYESQCTVDSVLVF